MLLRAPPLRPFRQHLLLGIHRFRLVAAACAAGGWRVSHSYESRCCSDHALAGTGWCWRCGRWARVAASAARRLERRNGLARRVDAVAERVRRLSAARGTVAVPNPTRSRSREASLAGRLRALVRDRDGSTPAPPNQATRAAGPLSTAMLASLTVAAALFCAGLLGACTGVRRNVPASSRPGR